MRQHSTRQLNLLLLASLIHMTLLCNLRTTGNFRISQIGIFHFSTYLEIMDIDATEKIGRTLRKLRSERKLTQTAVASELNKHQSYVSKIEMGEKSLHLYEVFAYADALDVPCSRLLSDVEHALTGKRTIPIHPAKNEYAIVELPGDNDPE